MSNVLGEILDRDSGRGTADISLREHQLVKGDVGRCRQLDRLNGLCHVRFSGTSGREPLSASNPFAKRPALLSLSLFSEQRRCLAAAALLGNSVALASRSPKRLALVRTGGYVSCHEPLHFGWPRTQMHGPGFVATM